VFVGWDWASAAHDVTVLNDQGRVVDRWAFAHTERALTKTLVRLARHGTPADMPVIIERPDGLIVDRLLAAGHPVVPVHPTAFHAARAPGGVPPAPSPTPVTVANSPTTSAPMAIGCVGCGPPTPAWSNCGR
jgi:hypothetical protein